MKRQSLFAVILDSVLAAACAFILIFTLTRFYTHRPVLGLCLGIAAFAAAGALAFLRLNARRGNALQKGRAQKKLAAFEKYTCTLTASGAAELIAAATGGSCADIEYIALFRPEPLTANELCAATAHESGRRKCVVCNRAGDAAGPRPWPSAANIRTHRRCRWDKSRSRRAPRPQRPASIPFPKGSVRISLPTWDRKYTKNTDILSGYLIFRRFNSAL